MVDTGEQYYNGENYVNALIENVKIFMSTHFIFLDFVILTVVLNESNISMAAYSNNMDVPK